MTKRALCFLSVLLLALLPAFASADCTHHNDDGVPYPLFPQGYIPPQVGVPGYTGDQCCTNCGTVVIRGSEIPALDPPQEEEANKREDPVPVPAAEQPVVEQPVVEQPVVAQPVVEQPVVPQEQPQAPSGLHQENGTWYYNDQKVNNDPYGGWQCRSTDHHDCYQF